MKDFNGNTLSKDEEIKVLRESITSLKDELMRMRDRQRDMWVEAYESGKLEKIVNPQNKWGKLGFILQLVMCVIVLILLWTFPSYANPVVVLYSMILLISIVKHGGL